MGVVNVTLGLWQDRPPAEAFQTAKAADQLGFGELWIGEMATFDAFALATAIGTMTQQIIPSVGPFPVSVRTPVNVAMGAATVSLAIGRPVNVALGTSSDVVVGQWHGRDRTRSAKRLDESAVVLRELLRGDKVYFEGETVRTSGFHLRLPPPTSRLSVAAFGSRAIGVAAARADRVLLNMVTVDAARRLCADIETAAAAAGRPRPTVAMWIAASVDPTEADRAQMVRSKTGYLAAPGYSDMFVAAGFGELVDYARSRPHPKDLRAAMPDSAIIAATCVAGSAQEVWTRIEQYFEAGVDEVCIAPTTAGDPGGLRTLRAVAARR
ncbi:LLM class F420-dependent oxidoreductase [Streptosporangium sp. NPDC087985]|uniref:LLM class F420-dependent oxidoreductase n=1 Tax=Streptosporangium sp. NPDC087985 TaxID=3366196 RepID=UPI0037FABDA8